MVKNNFVTRVRSVCLSTHSFVQSKSKKIKISIGLSTMFIDCVIEIFVNSNKILYYNSYN